MIRFVWMWWIGKHIVHDAYNVLLFQQFIGSQTRPDWKLNHSFPFFLYMALDTLEKKRRHSACFSFLSLSLFFFFLWGTLHYTACFLHPFFRLICHRFAFLSYYPRGITCIIVHFNQSISEFYTFSIRPIFSGFEASRTKGKTNRLVSVSPWIDFFYD